MGGYGSGRHSGKPKAEDCRALDIYKMKRLGCLRNGHYADWVWFRNDEEVARIGYRCTWDALILDYLVLLNDGAWEPVTQTVPLTRVPCNYGGQRTYALCPGATSAERCGRRVGKLYVLGKWFLCRHCCDLAYQSQSEPGPDRMLRRANKIRMQLGGELGAGNLIAPRPKGMWRRTYNRKRVEIRLLEHQADWLFMAKFQHLFGAGDLSQLYDD
jgi:hypothetical protein